LRTVGPSRSTWAVAVTLFAVSSFYISSSAFVFSNELQHLIPDNSWPNNPYSNNAIKREWPDGPNKTFLENLQRPDNDKHPNRDRNSQSCCDAADTVQTTFKVEFGEGKHPEDRWYAFINGEWVLVPPEKVVSDYAPDGQAFLFMLAGKIECFVRPKGGL
jgi:hypothetical protein